MFRRNQLIVDSSTDEEDNPNNVKVVIVKEEDMIESDEEQSPMEIDHLEGKEEEKQGGFQKVNESETEIVVDSSSDEEQVKDVENVLMEELDEETEEIDENHSHSQEVEVEISQQTGQCVETTCKSIAEFIEENQKVLDLISASDYSPYKKKNLTSIQHICKYK